MHPPPADVRRGDETSTAPSSSPTTPFHVFAALSSLPATATHGPSQVEKAGSLLLDMRATRGVPTNMSSYRAVMDAHCRAGDWASALGLLEDSRRDKLKPGTGELRAMVEV